MVATDVFNPADTSPTEKGWYLVRATDGRWNGETRYRAWGNGFWWIPLRDGWISSNDGLYEWQGPVADINGPAPDGTNPKPKKEI